MSDDSSKLPIPEIADIFHGVEDNAEPALPRYTLERWLRDPPPYMVRLALGCGGFKIYRGGDKSVWEACIRYEGIPFSISDWKRESWQIGSAEKNDEVLAAGERLKKKIGQAAQRLDKMVAEWGKSLVADGKFFITNTYPKVRGAYEHFRHAMEEAATRESTSDDWWPSDSEVKEQKIGGMGATIKLDVEMTRRLNAEFRRRSDAAYNGYAAVGFYFSSLEVLFDALFAFGPQPESFRNFRNRSWAERFKAVLPPASNPELAKIYTELRRIKADERDVLFHGTGDAESLLVAFPHLGMVPVSYQGTTDSVLFNSMVVLDADLLKKAMQTFDDFDAWIEAHDPYCYALDYLNCGFVIPFYGKALEKVRNAMTDEMTFKEFIEDELRAADYYLNDYTF